MSKKENKIESKEESKKDIHPQLKKSKVKCACGNSFDTYSVLDSIIVDICNKCHPFYTGKQKVASSLRVDRYESRRKKMEKLKK